MSYRKEIIELREIIPIGIKEAQRLLVENSGNIALAKDRFIDLQIEKIQAQTQEDWEVVKDIFVESSYDLHRCLSKIEMIQYDRTFDEKRLEGLSRESFQLMEDWLAIEDHEDISSALISPNAEQVIFFISKHLAMPELADGLREARVMIRELGLLSKDVNPEEFTLRLNSLKANLEYQRLVRMLDEMRIRFQMELTGLKRNFERLKYT